MHIAPFIDLDAGHVAEQRTHVERGGAEEQIAFVGVPYLAVNGATV